MRIAAALLLMSTSAMAEGSSSSYSRDERGEFGSVVSRYNATGELFRIEGRCHPACTMFLGIRNVCIEPGASFVFRTGQDRAGRDRQRKNVAQVPQQMPHHLMSAYNGSLRSYLQSSGADTTLSGNEVISMFGYRKCPAR